MAENTPVGLHFWNEVTTAVIAFNTFVQNSTAKDSYGEWNCAAVTSSDWAKELQKFRNDLPSKPDRRFGALLTGRLELVEIKFRDWESPYAESDAKKVDQYIRVCKTREQKRVAYFTAFAAFARDQKCELLTYFLERHEFVGWAPRICMNLGALKIEHLTLINVVQDYENELSFLTHRQRCNLADIVREIKEKEKTKQELARRVILEKEQPKPAQRADPPRKPLVVVASNSRAQLEYMRACLLGV